MIATSTGYKVTLASGVMDKVDSATTFFDNLANEGVWYAMTGKHFGEWCVDLLKSMVQFVVDGSDILIVVALVFLLLVMFGSSRVKKWLYWTVILYLCLKVLGEFL